MAGRGLPRYIQPAVAEYADTADLERSLDIQDATSVHPKPVSPSATYITYYATDPLQHNGQTGREGTSPSDRNKATQGCLLPSTLASHYILPSGLPISHRKNIRRQTKSIDPSNIFCKKDTTDLENICTVLIRRATERPILLLIAFPKNPA